MVPVSLAGKPHLKHSGVSCHFPLKKWMSGFIILPRWSTGIDYSVILLGENNGRWVKFLVLLAYLIAVCSNALFVFSLFFQCSLLLVFFLFILLNIRTSEINQYKIFYPHTAVWLAKWPVSLGFGKLAKSGNKLGVKKLLRETRKRKVAPMFGSKKLLKYFTRPCLN